MLSDTINLCQTLYENYDGSLLNNTNPDIKEIFKNIVTKAKDSGKGNIPLINIIYNYFYGILQTPDNISGPFSLEYQKSKEYDMKIYIFGESHGYENQCSEFYKQVYYLSISEYLNKVFLNSDKFIDFYLEESLFITSSKSDYRTLGKLREDFHKCLNPKTRSDCIYKTIRTHFVDTRMEQKGLELVSTNPFTHFHLYLENDIKIKDMSHIKLISQKLLLCNNHADIANLFLDIAKNIPIIKKELKRCYLDENLILNFFLDLLTKKLYKDINISRFHFLIQETIYGVELNDNDRKYLRQIILIIASPMVDIYTICRMFKTFKNKNNLPVKQKHIIYYAGNAHSINIRTFLTFLKFETVFYLKQRETSRCLDMQGEKLDFK